MELIPEGNDYYESEGNGDKWDTSVESLIDHAVAVAEAKGVRIAVQVLCGDK